MQLTKQLDDARHEKAECDKDNSELKLKIEIMNNTYDCLKNEKKHLEVDYGD
jgi:hypothetical protein